MLSPIGNFGTHLVAIFALTSVTASVGAAEMAILDLSGTVTKELIVQERIGSFKVHELARPVRFEASRIDLALPEDSPIRFVARYIFRWMDRLDTSTLGAKEEARRQALIAKGNEMLQNSKYVVKEEIYLSDGKVVIYVHAIDKRSAKVLSIAPYFLKKTGNGWSIWSDPDPRRSVLRSEYPFKGANRYTVRQSVGELTATDPSEQRVMVPFGKAVVEK